jgi:serine/threonine-protein kinase RsbW
MNMPTSNQDWTWQCDRRIANDAALGRQLLGDLLRQLDVLHWSHHDRFGVHLAVEEALMNAIHHGNAGDPAKHVQFSARACPTKVRVEITDEGLGFDPDRLPDPTAPERLGCPGGRGVLLMRAFMSRVEFRDRGNHVVLEKERSP